MIRSAIAGMLLVSLSSCSLTESGGTDKPDASPVTVTPAGTPEKASQAMEAVETQKATEEATAVVEDAESKAEEAASKTEGSIETATQKLDEISTAVAEFKESLQDLSLDKVKVMGEELLASLQKENGLVETLQAKIRDLGVADPQGLSEWKGKLETALDNVNLLKGKLDLVVGKLRESGVDVTKYLSVLKGA